VKRISILFLLAIFSTNLIGQIHWNKSPHNPVMLARGFAIGYASSADGISWIKATHYPVFKGTPETRDAQSIIGSRILFRLRETILI